VSAPLTTAQVADERSSGGLAGAPTVLVDGDGEVVGRVNLVDLADGSAELGYRTAERAAGRGLATSAVRRVCGLASTDYGLTSLRDATARDNLASQAVLTRAGFVLAGSVELDGQPEVRFVRDLTVDGTGRPADR